MGQAYLVDDSLLEDVLGLGSLRLQHLPEHPVHVGPVVQAGSALLLLGAHVGDALVDEAPEVLLVEDYAFVLLQAVLQVQLEDGPQGFDGVELGTVRRQVQQFDVQLPS